MAVNFQNGNIIKGIRDLKKRLLFLLEKSISKTSFFFFINSDSGRDIFSLSMNQSRFELYNSYLLIIKQLVIHLSIFKMILMLLLFKTKKKNPNETKLTCSAGRPRPPRRASALKLSIHFFTCTSVAARTSGARIFDYLAIWAGESFGTGT